MAEDMIIETAADGTQIGSVSPAPNGDADVEYAPATFNERTGLVNRLERAMAPDTILDGNDPEISQDVVERLLPGYFDNEKRMKAIELYVTGEHSLHSIAEELKVPDRTVAKWAEVGNWIEFNDAIVATLKKHERARITAMRVRERETAIDEQVDLGHKISKVGKEILETVDSAGQFKAVAEGLKLGSDMVGRALAISESGKVDADPSKPGGGGEDGGVRPLVMVFRSEGGLPPVPKSGEVVNV